MHEDAEVLWCVLLISHTRSCVLLSSPISTAKLISLTTTINIFTSFPARHMHSRPLSEVQLHFFNSFLFSMRKILSRGFFSCAIFFSSPQNIDAILHTSQTKIFHWTLRYCTIWNRMFYWGIYICKFNYCRIGKVENDCDMFNSYFTFWGKKHTKNILAW